MDSPFSVQVGGPADLAGVLAQVREEVLPRLRTVVDRLPASMSTVAGYHFGWCDEYGRPADGFAGKLVRPALTLLCAQGVGASAGDAVDAAVAVELVHNFSLLHDDVMDGDATRRHRRTVWSVFGIPTAILAGDALLVLAVQVLASAPGSVAALCEALQGLVDGQSLDMSFEERSDVTVEECLTMIGGKTAVLLRCACELGAIHGGGTPAQAVALARFGWHVGIAFQLIDDLLGIWGDPAVTGKPTLSDLRAGKKSLPVVAALTAGGAPSRRLADLYLRPEPLTEAELVTAARLVDDAGGRDWAETRARHYVEAALNGLAAAQLRPDSHQALVAMADLITGRRH
jgi:geranylgeranyl diphosphate synthase type I